MPARISNSVYRALDDGRVTRPEVSKLIAEAKANPSLEAKQELTELLASFGETFAPAERAQLERFLSTYAPTASEAPTPNVVSSFFDAAGTMFSAITSKASDWLSGLSTLPPGPVADPKVLPGDVTNVSWRPVRGGELYVDGISADDVLQGTVANCHLHAALSAMANTNPELIKNAISPKPDGTYDVKLYFKERVIKSVVINVDADVAQARSGKTPYGKSRDPKELWVGLIEKAYAQLKGGFEAIDTGADSQDALLLLTGRLTTFTPSSKSDDIFKALQSAEQRKKPAVATSFSQEYAELMKGTGISPWHVYSVLGTEVENGERYVKLRNPWGHTEPGNGGRGSDGKNDGSFRMTLDAFANAFEGITVSN